MKKFFIFVIICIVVASVGFTTYYLMTEQQTLRITQTIYELNVGDNPELKVEMENVKTDKPFNVEPVNPEIVDYKLGHIIAKKGGKGVLKITSPIASFRTTYVQVTVGDGASELTPLYINSSDDLLKIGNTNENSYFTASAFYKVTVKALDFTNKVWNGICGSTEFNGTVDFNDCEITGVASTATRAYNGLFQRLGGNAVIKNLKLSAPNFSGSFSTGVGAVAGQNKGTILNCTITNATIKNTAAYAGGVVGKNYGTIERCSVANSNVTSDASYAGGIAGQHIYGEGQATIERCRANAVVKGSTGAGGIVGHNSGATVLYCYSEKVGTHGGVSSTGTSAVTGGIVGYNEGVNGYPSVVVDCYTILPVSGAGTKGAIFGKNKDYSSTAINYIYGCYYNSGLSGVSKAVGTGDDVDTSVGFVASGVTLDQLKNQATFVSHGSVAWNFDEVWTFTGSTTGYPVLNMKGGYVPLALETIEKISNNNNNYTNPDSGSSGSGSSGSGTSTSTNGDIKTVSDLNNIRKKKSGNYTLKANIDLSSISDWTPIGTEDAPFTGSLTSGKDSDGKYYTISNLKITSRYDFAGLFGYVGASGKISNITVNNARIDCGYCVGVIAGYNAGQISGCTVKSTNTSTIKTSSANQMMCIGGIAGTNTGSISKCNVVGQKIIGSTTYYTMSAGGVVGDNMGTVSSCKSTATVTVNKGTSAYVGGVVGNNCATVVGSFSSGTIATDMGQTVGYTGGVVGNNTGTITKSFFTGKATGYYVGGIAGYSTNSISESYSNATIEGHLGGGLVCVLPKGTVSDCYSTCSMKGDNKDACMTGFAYEVGYSSEIVCGNIVRCFGANTFSGSGNAYYETQSYVRDPEYTFIWTTPRCAGYITNSIYDKEISKAKEMTQSSIFGDGGEPIGLSTVDCKSHSKQFDLCDFSGQVWVFGQYSYPTLRNVPKAW